MRNFDHRTAQRRKPGRVARHRRQPFGNRDHAKHPRTVTEIMRAERRERR